MAKQNASKCAVAQLCGACDAIDVPYEKQLEEKQARIVELFDDLADEDCVLHPICGMSEPYHYRNKVASPFAPGKRPAPSGKGKGQSAGKGARGKRGAKPGTRREILCGMYAKGTHRIIDSSCCLLENEEAKRIIQAIKQLMPKFGIEPYNEDTGSGFMRHAIVRVGHSTGEILVTLVTNGAQFPASKAFCRELCKRVPSITTIVQNVNTRQTNVILGNEGEQRLYGPGFILDDLCGLRFRISSHSFYQVNATQTEVLYRRAIELAGLTGNEVVMDAYCGTGTIGLVAAKGLGEAPGAGKVIGVDKVPEAIKDARNNAHHNKIENAEFFAQDAGDFMQRLAREGGQIDVLFMDPPRAGSSLEFLHVTCALKPQRIVYISCGPNTQARDVDHLVKNGYKLTDIQPVDMFPHTGHIENICRLELKD
ncbi:MAG: 23S rRNA (uracil(1939)-C(5))-methyltransferase RlmD [Coriobacteriia bacterium]|nr:23S rRNA (uracil(1939)-C(5))-methyltransferase RlmD [Coriobacteriia bacterium]